MVRLVTGSETPSSDIDKDLDMLEKAMVAEFGENAAMRLNSPNTLSKIDHWCSTRSIVVDKVLAGGRPLPCSLVPFGRQIEVAGLYGSGKTTLCAQVAAETQAQGGLVTVTDTEDRIDHPYWRTLGVDTDRIINIHADTIEEVFERQYKAIQFMREKAPTRPLLMLWDSVGATASGNVFAPSKDETFMEAAEKMMGRDAKTIAAGMKVINGMVSKSRVCYMYTNHIYSKMNVTYGDKDETYGGNKIKFFATVRLRLTSIASIYEEDELGNKNKVGQRVLVEAKKNSMAPILMKKEAVILGSKGFCNEYTVWDVASKLKLIAKSGAWATWTAPDSSEVKFQGFSGFLEKVVSHPGYQQLVKQVMEIL